jgi:hypothetical protein
VLFSGGRKDGRNCELHVGTFGGLGFLEPVWRARELGLDCEVVERQAFTVSARSCLDSGRIGGYFEEDDLWCFPACRRHVGLIVLPRLFSR